jgi:hypothetical protein
MYLNRVIFLLHQMLEQFETVLSQEDIDEIKFRSIISSFDVSEGSLDIILHSVDFERFCTHFEVISRILCHFFEYEGMRKYLITVIAEIYENTKGISRDECEVYNFEKFIMSDEVENNNPRLDYLEIICDKHFKHCCENFFINAAIIVRFIDFPELTDYHSFVMMEIYNNGTYPDVGKLFSGIYYDFDKMLP